MKAAVRLFAGIALAAGLSSLTAWAQSVISAKSGLIHYAEGRTLLDGQPVEPQFGNFPEVKENGVLRTEEGRAEVLLTPGVILRVGESSSIRMITNRLIDTRVEFLSGSALVEAADLPKDNAVTVVYKDYSVRLLKKGLYRFDSEPAQLRVYDGEAQAEAGGRSAGVNEGRSLAFNGELALTRFDTKDGDALFRWAKRRSEYLAVANVSAAQAVSRQSGSAWRSSGWVWNPYFSMFTYVPMSGMYSSPFGYAFWSPFTVYRAYSYYNNRGIPPGAYGRGRTVAPVVSAGRPVSGISRGGGMIAPPVSRSGGTVSPPVSRGSTSGGSAGGSARGGGTSTGRGR